jgi:hypothetical protein
MVCVSPKSGVISYKEIGLVASLCLQQKSHFRDWFLFFDSVHWFASSSQSAAKGLWFTCPSSPVLFPINDTVLRGQAFGAPRSLVR